MSAPSKVQVCSRSPAETVGSNPTVGTDVCLLWVLCVVRQRSLCRADQKSLAECGVSECDGEASTVRRPWPMSTVTPWEEKKYIYVDNESISHSVGRGTLSSSQIWLCFIVALEYLRETPDSSVGYVLTALGGHVSIKIVLWKLHTTRVVSACTKCDVQVIKGCSWWWTNIARNM